MKVLYFSPRPFGLMGTPGTYQLTEALHKVIDVCVVCAKNIKHSFDIVHTADSSLNKIEIDLSSKQYKDDLENILIDFAPDIVCIANYAKWYEVVKTVKKVNTATKIILDIKSPLIVTGTLGHDTFNKVQLNSKKYSYLLDSVISRCEEDIQTWIPGYSEKSFIYPLGVDLDKFPISSTKSSEKLALVFIGSYAKNRKLFSLLTIFSQLSESIKNKITLDMYGSGPEFEYLKQLVKEMSLDTFITINGALSQKDLFVKLQNYEVGLGWVPKTIYDAAPSLKSLEYIASGLIPLLTATRGHVRDVTSGFNALLFEESSESLEQALWKIINRKISPNFIEDNLKHIQKRDWSCIVDKYFLPHFSSLSKNHISLKYTKEEKQMQYESHWLLKCKPFQSTLECTKDLKVLALTTERLYYGLKDEVDYVPLSEEKFERQLANEKFSFLLIETCMESLLGNWNQAMSRDVCETLLTCIRKVQSYNIPVLVWNTVDYEYLDHYEMIMKMADYVGYADSRYEQVLKEWNIDCFELLPAIQPRIFNPLRVPTIYAEEDFDILLQSSTQLGMQKDIFETYKTKKFTYFERTAIPTRNHLRNLKSIGKNLEVEGKISYRLLPEVLKRANSIVIDESVYLTSTEQTWQFLENSACRCMSFFSSENTTFISDFLKHFVKHYELFSSDPLNKAIHTQNEKLKYQSKFVNIWREILDNHTFSHRVDSIRRRLHLLPNDKNTLKISIVTPTKRVKNISNVLRNFNQQNYHSKELVIVVNSKYEDYISLKNMLEKYENIQILHMPEDKKAASSLNYAIKHLDGEYFFRFDDDDYYGEEYIADAMRFLKIDDAHIIGKFASYIKIEEKDKVFLRKNSTEEKQLLSFSAKDFTLRDCAMSGATFGVRVALLKQFTFPEESLKTADSSWLELIRKEGEDIRCIKTDFFQFTIGRHIEKNDHTWETELSNLINLNNEVEHNIVEVPR